MMFWSKAASAQASVVHVLKRVEHAMHAGSDRPVIVLVSGPAFALGPSAALGCVESSQGLTVGRVALRLGR